VTRIIAAAFAASALAFSLPLPAQAQSKPKAAKCTPIEDCIKRCGERGGQIRLCPKWCNDQARLKGC
jgi:hypothetical protein